MPRLLVRWSVMVDIPLMGPFGVIPGAIRRQAFVGFLSGLRVLFIQAFLTQCSLKSFHKRLQIGAPWRQDINRTAQAQHITGERRWKAIGRLAANDAWVSVADNT